MPLSLGRALWVTEVLAYYRLTSCLFLMENIQGDDVSEVPGIFCPVVHFPTFAIVSSCQQERGAFQQASYLPS